jgi:HK97 family phage prohead protease
VVEQRTLSLDQLTFRDQGGRFGFTGHASTFTRYAYDDPTRFGWWEEMGKSAFDRALAEDQDVVFLVNHNDDYVLARTTSGTMQLDKDKRGLVVSADLADTTVGRDLRVLLERRDVNAMSIAFTVVAEEWKTQKDGTDVRIINDLNLYDVSAVTRPANPDTDASLRSATLEAVGRERARQRWQEAQQRFDQLKAPSRGF